MIIPFSPPAITEDDCNAVLEVLRSGWITTGPRTKEFERHIANYCGTSRAVCFNSATAGLEMILKILGVGPGDEVIVPVYTYTASASPVLHLGAKLVFIDASQDNLDINLTALERSITPRTKAIIAVDIAGRMCNYPGIIRVAEARKSIFSPSSVLQEAIGRIAVIADAAHSLGARRDQVYSGAAADFTSFSFHAVKNLTTAEGGAVTWRSFAGIDDNDLYSRMTVLSLHGQTKDALTKNQIGSWEYDVTEPAYKCNMTDIAAALGLSQLRRYNSILARRNEIIELYDQALLETKAERLDHYSDNSESSGHLYITYLPEDLRITRDRFIDCMAEEGIVCNVHYKPLALMTAYRRIGIDAGDYPNAVSIFRRAVSLPLNNIMSNNDVNYVSDRFVKLLKRNV